MNPLAFPYSIDRTGRTAQVTTENHVRDLIEQLIFTSPGERVNRPDFGSGVLQLLFAPSSPELATATQFLIQGALQQWLGDLIVVDAVDVDTQDSTIRISVAYLIRRSQDRQIAQFERSV